MDLSSGQIYANAVELMEDKVYLIVSVKDYNLHSDKRKLIPIKQKDKIGLINHNYEIVLPPKYDDILDTCYQENDLIRVSINKIVEYSPQKYRSECRYGVINYKGELVFNVVYRTIILSTDCNMVTLQNEKYQYGVFDRNGTLIIPFGKYQYIDGFHRGYARIKSWQDGKWGIINEKGEEVLALRYKNIWNFYEKDYETIIIEDDCGQTKIKFNSLNPKKNEPSYCLNDDDFDYKQEKWDALTDGMYGDYPGGDVDYDGLGF